MAGVKTRLSFSVYSERKECIIASKINLTKR